MFHHSSIRNHRSKGSHVKKIFQVVVLLAVACWLLYQIKHSRHKKIDYTGNAEIKPGKVGEEIFLGRRGDAGSENVIVIDTNAKGFDESTEMKQDEVQHDSSVLNNEDISKEMIPNSHKLADSLEIKPEQDSNSHANDGENKLLLPSMVRDNSSSQSGSSEEGGSNLEENGHLDDKEKQHEDIKSSDLAVDDGVDDTITGDQTTLSSAIKNESIKNNGEENEGTSGRADSQELSVNDEASKGKVFGSLEHSSSLSEISMDNMIDNQTVDHDHISSAHGDTSTTNDLIDHELNNVVANNEVSKEGEVGTQLEKFFEVENTDKNSSIEMKASQESEKERKNSFSDAKVQNSTDTSDTVFVESQADRGLVDSQVNEASAEENTLEANNNDAVELQVNDDSGEAENSQNNSLESKNVTNNPDNVVSTGGTAESRGNEDGKPEEKTADVIVKEGGTVNEEGKNEKALNDEAVTSLEVNEEVHLDDFTNKIAAGEVVEAEGGSNSEGESTTGINDDESKTE